MVSVKKAKLNHFNNIDSSGLKNGDRISLAELNQRRCTPSSKISTYLEPTTKKTISRKSNSKSNDLMLKKIKDQLEEWRDLFSKGIQDYLNNLLKEKKQENKEYFEQSTFMYYVASEHEDLRYRIHASPNGANRGNGYETWRLKVAGMSVGWPDVELMKQNKTYNGLFIEFKKRFDDYPSIERALKEVKVEQHKHRVALNTEGYLSVVCYGSDEAIEVLEAYLNDLDIPTYINNRWIGWDCENLKYLPNVA